MKLDVPTKMMFQGLLSLAEEFTHGTATDEERLSILKSALKDRDYELWIAEVNGEIVGFIDLWTMHDFCHGEKLTYIQNLYVAPKYRRLGGWKQTSSESHRKS